MRTKLIAIVVVIMTQLVAAVGLCQRAEAPPPLPPRTQPRPHCPVICVREQVCTPYGYCWLERHCRSECRR
jgi:hypothetical protein